MIWFGIGVAVGWTIGVIVFWWLLKSGQFNNPTEGIENNPKIYGF